MMASTMAIPQVALPNFHGPMQAPMPNGTIPGNVQPAMPGTYPCQVPVTVHQGPVVSPPLINGNNTPATAISPPIQTLRVPVVPVGGGCYNDGMEVVWHGEFSRLFSSFFPPHVWYLSITNSAPQEKWKFYRDSAKVRFCCQDCGNGWTSMKGRVTFWFHLDTRTSEGFVQFKLYGQVCKKCNSGKFEYVMWYPEEVSKVMCNLYNKVGQTFYGFMQPPIRIDRRPGRPRNQHNAELCQACRDGECDQGRPVKPLYNFIPSPLNPRCPAPPIPGRLPIAPNPMGHGQLPILIRQPPIPHSGHLVMQAPANAATSHVPGPLVQVSHNGHQLITAPVTLTSGIQPILTYSIVTAPVKDPVKLTPVDEAVETKSNNSPAPVELTNGHVSPTPDSEQKMENQTPVITTKLPTVKPVTVSIKTPMVNGVLPGTTRNVKPVEEKFPSLVKTSSTVVPKVAASFSKMKISDPESATNGIEEEEKKTQKVPILNGYAAAAAGNAQSVEVIVANGQKSE